MEKLYVVLYVSYFVETGLYTEALATNVPYNDAVRILKDKVKEHELKHNCIDQTKQITTCLWQYSDKFGEVVRMYKIQEVK